jgi:GAF domain-containing protein
VEIVKICDKLEALLASRQGAEAKMEASVNALCSIFTVARNEVAIFGLDPALDSFSFLWPLEMRSSGSIPFSANRSLVSTTAGERRCFMNNSFSSTPHLFVFEAYGKERTAPIQKIMSVPMLKGDELTGVIQVCRKGEDSDTSLKSFTERELTALGEIAKVIGRHL